MGHPVDNFHNVSGVKINSSVLFKVTFFIEMFFGVQTSGSGRQQQLPLAVLLLVRAETLQVPIYIVFLVKLYSNTSIMTPQVGSCHVGVRILSEEPNVKNQLRQSTV